MNRLRWAVFDVDGTVLPGTSMEKILITALFKYGMIQIRSVSVFFFMAVRSFFQGTGISAFLKNKQYFRGLPESMMVRLSSKLVRTEVIPRIPGAVQVEMDRLRRSGYRIALMSGAPEFLLRPLAEHLRVDAAIGTVLETNSGSLTGIVLGEHLYGTSKTRILRRHQKSLKIDFSKSIVYANDTSDADHMRLFGTAVAVNPRKGLRRAAEEYGWKVVWW
jgi:HAD superfamily phosphoserine phosphatase-like hydrolase